MQLESTASNNTISLDSDRFKLLFDAYYRKLLIFADSFLLNTAAAEDIIQSIFADVWQSGVWKTHLYPFSHIYIPQ
jgi:DNA-directed RNA polymerase specialized sigma24 family protein